MSATSTSAETRQTPQGTSASARQPSSSVSTTPSTRRRSQPPIRPPNIMLHGIVRLLPSLSAPRVLRSRAPVAGTAARRAAPNGPLCRLPSSAAAGQRASAMPSSGCAGVGVRVSACCTARVISGARSCNSMKRSACRRSLSATIGKVRTVETTLTRLPSRCIASTRRRNPRSPRTGRCDRPSSSSP